MARICINCGPLARTLCSDGFTISTMSFEGMGHDGGDFEVAVLSGRRFGADIVGRFETALEATRAHADEVRRHGGAAGWLRRLFG